MPASISARRARALGTPRRSYGSADDDDLGCLLDGALSRVRWATLAAVLALAVAVPLPGRTVLPGWALIGIFIAYNLLVEALRLRLPWLASFATVAVFDLPVVAILYYLALSPGDPLYIIFLLAVTCAAASMPLRGSVVYTLVALLLVAGITPLLPHWSAARGNARDLGVRLIVLGLVGLGSALLLERLRVSRAAARTQRAEAERLAELDQLRSDFVSTVSHDLRTPLTAARAGLGMLEASARDRLQPAESQLLENALRNVERLSMLIDDLLVFNLLAAGAMRLEPAALDLRVVVARAAAALNPLLAEKRQTLTVDLPEPLPIEGDARRLEQTIVNILDNAQRHTPPGTRITVTGRATPAEIVLSVGDNGPGIAAAELERIFTRFHRGPAARGGTGLGLAIARGVAELHGGRLWAESVPGAGSTFHLALPRHTPSAHGDGRDGVADDDKDERVGDGEGDATEDREAGDT